MATITKQVKPEYFKEIRNFHKEFILSKDVDNVQVGDKIVIQEYNDKKNEITGKEFDAIVTYVMRNAQNYGLMPGYCIIGW